MTDNDIVKTLESIASESIGDCKRDCAFYDGKVHYCAGVVAKHSLDLINRQKAEIAELEAEIDKQYEQAKADILGNMSNGGTSCHWCIDKHRTEAVKEFAEMLKNSMVIKLDRKFYFPIIDNLVKEMTEE